MTAPTRIQLRRTRGWRKPAGAVVVARPTIWGNPFTIGAATEFGARDPRRLVVAAFRDWLAGDPWACGCLDDHAARRAKILARLPDLRGRDLACWCPLDQPCHADVLLEIANR